VFWLQQILLSLIAVGFFSLNGKGWLGACVLLFFQSLALPFFLIVLSCHERRERLPGRKIIDFPLFALSTAWAALFALFLPVSVGFYGVLLVIWSLATGFGWFLPFVIVSIPIVAIAGMNSMFFDLGERPEGGERPFHDLTVEEILAILPIGSALLILGLMPKIVTGPIGAATSALLRGMGLGN
jgi:NADH:ubiquinone oxidoreductase subunit 4 (subunit M)